MNTLLVATLTAITGITVAVITGIVSYRTARWNLRRDLEVELRRQRLEAFRQLWAISEPLAKYGRTGPAATATPDSMEKLSGELRHWYFRQGGMFLSNESRDAYFHFQDTIQSVVQTSSARDTPLAEPTREEIREAGGALRTSLRDAFKGFPKM